LFAASAATAITTFGGTTTVLCATEAKFIICVKEPSGCEYEKPNK
jgi:hypothetical protein